MLFDIGIVVNKMETFWISLFDDLGCAKVSRVTKSDSIERDRVNAIEKYLHEHWMSDLLCEHIRNRHIQVWVCDIDPEAFDWPDEEYKKFWTEYEVEVQAVPEFITKKVV